MVHLSPTEDKRKNINCYISFNKSNNSRQQLHSKLESTYMCVLMSLITPYYYYYINIIGDELLLIFAAKFQRLLYIVVTICLLIG